MKRLSKFCQVLAIALVLFLCSCSVTSPRFSYSGDSYSSISDDIIMEQSKLEVITKLTDKLNAKDKILLVQVADGNVNNIIADQLYETLYRNNYFVTLVSKLDLKNFDLNPYNKTLMFYPIILGTEAAETTPSFWTMIVGSIPFIGKAVINKHTYIDRLAAISLHCRLIDNQSGEIDWIEDFTGQAKVRIHSGKMYDIVFPE